MSGSEKTRVVVLRWGAAVAALLVLALVVSAAGRSATPSDALEASLLSAGEKDDPEKKDPGKPDPEKKDGEESEGEDGKKKPKPQTPEEAYVQENIESYFSPTSLEWLEDGRVHLVFDFSTKSVEHEDIFTLPVGARMKDVFRWTVEQEESVIGGIPGIRVSDAGSAFLRLWFSDNVEAEIEFRQYINHEPRHLMAVVFQNDKGAGIGTNYGNQCATFSKGKLAKKSGEEVKKVVFDGTAKLKLKVKDGEFEALRENYLSAKTKYSPKSFSSGQVGFAWGGRQAGIIGKLEISGKLDYAKTRDEMKKKRSTRRR
jgi:hypothetical protein